MAKTHQIRQGESLLELAYEGGFDTWKRIWDEPANAELRERRKDPQVLLPGDAVVLPEKQSVPEASCPVDKVHRFRLVRPRAWVNLRMLDDDGAPLAGLRYTLRIDGHVHGGRTDDEGLISVEIRPNAHDGHLTLWLEEPDEAFEARVQVGDLDPACAPSGARARLRNLGLPCGGEQHDDLERAPVTRHLLETLQMSSRRGTPGGALDTALAQTLEDAHDQGA